MRGNLIPEEFGTDRMAQARRINKSTGLIGTVVANRTVEHDAMVSVAKDPLKITTPVKMEVPATSFQFSVDKDGLADALRPYIHERLQRLPSHHFIQVIPIVDAEGEFHGVNFNVVVPEKQ